MLEMKCFGSDQNRVPILSKLLTICVGTAIGIGLGVGVGVAIGIWIGIWIGIGSTIAIATKRMDIL